MNQLRIALVLAGLATAGLHVRKERQTLRFDEELVVPATAKVRRAILETREVQAEGQLFLRHELFLEVEPSAPDRVLLGPLPALAGLVDARDVTGNALPLEGRTLPIPSPDEKGARAMWLTFLTEPAPLTYGWGYRARALPFASTLVPRRVPLQVEVRVAATTSAMGWRCTGDQQGHVCSTDVRGRRTPALPFASYPDGVWKLVFALVLGTSISFLMWAVYRRWSLLAVDMGFKDSPDEEGGPMTMDEYLKDVARAKPRDSHPDEPEPLEAVALVARGITSVLGVVGAVFLVAHFRSGLFPIPAPIALSIVAALSAALIILAVGIDRPRPWLALGLTIAVALLALTPQGSFYVAALVPTAAAVLMQLTARSRP